MTADHRRFDPRLYEELQAEARESCVFCQVPDDRVVIRTASFVVMAGLGPITEGYTIVAPREHISSYSELPPGLWSEFEAVTTRLTELLKVYAPHLVCYEHGKAGGCYVEAEGDCLHCRHAHRVFVPWPTEPDILIDLPGRPLPAADIAELAKVRGRYIFCNDQVFPLEYGQAIASQFMRRALLAALGREGEYCWAKYPRMDVARRTAKQLRESWSC